MSQGLNVEENVSSPDLFSDSDPGLNVSNPLSSEEEQVPNEPETSGALPEWKGVSLEEIYKSRGPFEFQELPQIHPSATHSVLFCLPLSDRALPKPHPSNAVDKWCPGFVRMPHSAHSLYPIEKEGKKELRCRWEVIQEALLQSFTSSYQLEAAIFSYNHKYSQRWNFSALHHFFSEVVDEDEAEAFFTGLLPKIIQLALQLPSLITGPVPLLSRHANASISLSQLQVASLLANAFLCTFPRRNSTNPQSEYANYPYINFNKLFSAFRENRHDKCSSITEKLKCIFHYFRRVTSKAPEGTITIQRRYIPKADCPRWDQQSQKLPLLHITSNGTIESEGAGLLQVDFANMYVGGGVLGWGCVQEEIRFVICPELLVTMLVTEVLDDTEALVISGVERFSKYDGYSNTFKWMGDFVDETPRDNSGRRKTSVVAIDALFFKQPSSQFRMSNVIRELNKAYAGFKSNISQRDNLPAVATGNWGCGVFHGNPQLKVLLQLMAAASAGRNVVYFTFGDIELRDSVSEMYWHLVQQNIDIGHLFSLLSQYHESMSMSHRDFYRFLYNRSKMKPISDYFKRVKSSSVEKSHSKFSLTKIVKTPEKRKRESSSPIAKQSNNIEDDEIDKLFENIDEFEEEAKLKAKSKLSGDNGKVDISQDQNSQSRSSEKSECIKKTKSFPEERPKEKKFSGPRNGRIDSENQNQSTPKKKPSLWDLPMYEDSKISSNAVKPKESNLKGEEKKLENTNAEEHEKSEIFNKTVQSKDSNFKNRNENKLENTNTEMSSKNCSVENKEWKIENETKKSKLDTIRDRSPPVKKKLGQKKISDFFLSNL